MNPLALALILCTIAATHCTIINPQNNNANLIEKTCKQTPKYATCIKYLTSDPRSSDADLPRVADIMLNKVVGAASNIFNKINDFVKVAHEPALSEALNSCADGYGTILAADMPKSIAALKLGDPKLAQDGANNAAMKATSCENGFHGNSPLTEENAAMYDAAIIAAAIVKQLL